MAQRAEVRDGADDFPTPPWATRALIEHVLDDRETFRKMSCLEPACGAGHIKNMSGDSEQEYFSDGITEDIITALSQVRWLFVIARNSTFS